LELILLFLSLLETHLAVGFSMPVIKTGVLGGAILFVILQELSKK